MMQGPRRCEYSASCWVPLITLLWQRWSTGSHYLFANRWGRSSASPWSCWCLPGESGAPTCITSTVHHLLASPWAYKLCSLWTDAKGGVGDSGVVLPAPSGKITSFPVCESGGSAPHWQCPDGLLNIAGWGKLEFCLLLLCRGGMEDRSLFSPTEALSGGGSSFSFAVWGRWILPKCFLFC